MSPKLFNLLLIIGSFALYHFLVGPLYSGKDTGIWVPENNIQSLRENIRRHDNALSKIDAILSEASRFEKDYLAIDDEIKKNMEIMVPSKVDDIRLLSEVSKIAYDSGIAAKDITVKDKQGVFPKYNISVTVKASYKDFKNFMALYETSLRLFNIETVSFKSADEDGLSKFDLVLSTHYLK